MTTNETKNELFNSDIFSFLRGNSLVEGKELTIFIFELIVLALMAFVVVAFPLQAILPYMMALMSLIIFFILI